jgi:hypothetical protein
MITDHIHCLGSAAAAAEMRSSAGQCVRSHRSTKCSRLCSAFERNRGTFERTPHCVLGTEACARTQRRVWLSAGKRWCWNRRKCVRAQKLRSTALWAPDFPATQQKLKTKTKNPNKN